MVRINLLPAEIVERRKYERFYPYVFIAAAILFAIVIVTWLGLQLMVSQRNESLQQTEETVIKLQEQAAAFAIFQQQDEQLKTRQAAASKALQARVDMGTLMEEISLVLPEQVWLNSLTLDEAAGTKVVGNAPDYENNKMSDGYKLVAATLVRLNSLETLYDVWLKEALAVGFGDYQGADKPADNATASVVRFEANSKISLPPTTPVAPAPVAAPPAGQ